MKFEKSSTKAPERANDNEGPFSIGQNLWPGISKLIEECGEVIQIAGKLIATGGRTDHWSGLDLGVELEKEIGDLGAAIGFVIRHNPQLNPERIYDRTTAKEALFDEWHGKIPQDHRGH
jgi:hypothetical protein